ncbi:hypothetical protein QC760_000995 [Botrytis cinerea]
MSLTLPLLKKKRASSAQYEAPISKKYRSIAVDNFHSLDSTLATPRVLRQLNKAQSLPAASIKGAAAPFRNPSTLNLNPPAPPRDEPLSTPAIAIELHLAIEHAMKDQGNASRVASELINALNSLSDRDHRQQLQFEMLEWLIEKKNSHSDAIEEFFEYIKMDNSGDHQVLQEENEYLWEEANKIVKENRSKRNKFEEARRNVESKWGREICSWLCSIKKTGHFWASIRSLALKVDAAEAAERVNRVLIDRLRSSKVGQSNSPFLQAQDFIRSAQLKEWEAVATGEAIAFRLSINAYGFLELDSILSGAPLEIAARDEIESEGVNSAKGMVEIARVEGIEGGGEAAAADAISEVGEGSERFSSPAREINLAAHQSDHIASAIEGLTDDEQFSDGESAISSVKPRPRVAQYPSSRPNRHRKKRRPKSICSCPTSISRRWRARVEKLPMLKNGPWEWELLEVALNSDGACLLHCKALGNHLGMRTKEPLALNLLDNLKCIYQNRLDIGKLKVDPATYHLFRKENRPLQPRDSLELSNFSPINLYEDKFAFDQGAIRQWVGGGALIRRCGKGMVQS